MRKGKRKKNEILDFGGGNRGRDEKTRILLSQRSPRKQ